MLKDRKQPINKSAKKYKSPVRDHSKDKDWSLSKIESDKVVEMKQEITTLARLLQDQKDTIASLIDKKTSN